MIFKADCICKKYGGDYVLKDLSFEIGESEFFGVYGPSGCGKTTLAKIVCGAEEPDSGSCTRLGLKVQMIYQQPWSALDPVQKIGDGLHELVRYHGFAEKGKAENALILETLKEVGLFEDILGHLPFQISGGEAQRLSIARALLFQPKLLIMDEATSMLDVLTQAYIIELVKRVITDRGGSVLFISHDKELADHVCDRILNLGDY